jgi:predicted PurR-regulated permease PerM
MRKRRASISFTILLGLIAAASLFAGCGGDSEDDAKTQACDAVSNINTQVKQLQGYTLATVTTDKVNGNIDAIKADLSDIKAALPDVSSDLKSQLQTATDSFTSEVSAVASRLGKSTSVAAAATQISTAADQLAASYQRAFADVSC